MSACERAKDKTMCDMFHSIHGVLLICVRDMTPAYALHNSFICVARLIR